MEEIKPLIKNDYMVVRLEITDEKGLPIEKPFKLKDGENIFKCKATYNDGTQDFYSPYWTCPVFYRSGEYDVWSVFGQQRTSMVVLHASKNHERYSELACWVFPPQRVSPTGNAEIPKDGTGFDYSKIN